jgi:hypothetical protein
VKESSLVDIDMVSAVYTTTDSAGKLEDTYKIAGLDQLRFGRGVLTLTGVRTENGKPVEVRTTLRIGRNILEVMRETASTGLHVSSLLYDGSHRGSMKRNCLRSV